MGSGTCPGCNKHANNGFNRPGAELGNIRPVSSSPGVAAFERKIPGDDFLSGFGRYANREAREVLAGVIGDTVSYIIINNNGVFEEYLSIGLHESYLKLSSFNITEDPRADVKIEVVPAGLKINNVTMGGFNQFSGFDRMRLSAGSNFCCAACYTIHDILNLHILDCLCCMARCGFRCGKTYAIAWTGQV